jgi:hypothetical protein
MLQRPAGSAVTVLMEEGVASGEDVVTASA